MKIEAKFSALKNVKPHEYFVRFLFGGLVTVLAGLIAKRYGPGVGGLFLAFPAIFPATATLVEKHEKQKMHRAGLHGSRRGRSAAAVDAAGTSIGAIGLFFFAVIVWFYLPGHPAWIVLLVAGCAWFAISVLLWVIRKRI